MSIVNGEKIPRGLTVPQWVFDQAKRDFHKEISTDVEAIEWLLKKGYGNDPRCFYCSGTDMDVREAGQRSVKCKACRKETSLFANTMFANMKKPIAYVGVFWLRERNIGASANRYKDFANVVQSTADDIYKKLAFVLMHCMNAAEPTFVDTKEFISLYTRRSSQTNKEAHPSSEQTDLDEEEREKEEREKDESETQKNESAQKSVDDLPPGSEGWSEEMKKVYKTLSHVPLHTDSIIERAKLPIGTTFGSLTMLLLSKQIVDVGGDRYIAVQRAQPLSDHERNTIDQFDSYAGHVYEGISRKNVQLYLADFWAFVCRSIWTAENLVKACFSFRHIDYREIRRYVSPKIVQMLPA